MASINIHTDIDPDAGNDPLLHLLRDLAAATDTGQITHLNQITNITLNCDKQTADQLQAAARHAEVDIAIRHI